MLSLCLVVALLFQAGAPVAPTKETTKQDNVHQSNIASSKDADTNSSELLKVKRIYVDSFGEDVISRELQSMILSALANSKRFKVTENRDRADAILKGVALEKTSQELHAYGESTAVGGAAGSSQGSVNGTFINGTGSVSGSSSGGFIARHMGTSDSSVNTETINEARVAVRLVNPDGDVIWTSTQESKGAKYKGASADVADKCVKQLLRDLEKLEDGNTSSPSAVGTTSR